MPAVRSRNRLADLALQGALFASTRHRRAGLAAVGALCLSGACVPSTWGLLRTGELDAAFESAAAWDPNYRSEVLERTIAETGAGLEVWTLSHAELLEANPELLELDAEVDRRLAAALDEALVLVVVDVLGEQTRVELAISGEGRALLEVPPDLEVLAELTGEYADLRVTGGGRQLVHEATLVEGLVDGAHWMGDSEQSIPYVIDEASAPAAVRVREALRALERAQPGRRLMFVRRPEDAATLELRARIALEADSLEGRRGRVGRLQQALKDDAWWYDKPFAPNERSSVRWVETGALALDEDAAVWRAAFTPDLYDEQEWSSWAGPPETERPRELAEIELIGRIGIQGPVYCSRFTGASAIGPAHPSVGQVPVIGDFRIYEDFEGGIVSVRGVMAPRSALAPAPLPWDLPPAGQAEACAHELELAPGTQALVYLGDYASDRVLLPASEARGMPVVFEVHEIDAFIHMEGFPIEARLVDEQIEFSVRNMAGVAMDGLTLELSYADCKAPRGRPRVRVDAPVPTLEVQETVALTFDTAAPAPEGAEALGTYLLEHVRLVGGPGPFLDLEDDVRHLLDAPADYDAQCSVAPESEPELDAAALPSAR